MKHIINGEYVLPLPLLRYCIVPAVSESTHSRANYKGSKLIKVITFFGPFAFGYMYACIHAIHPPVESIHSFWNPPSQMRFILMPKKVSIIVM